MCTFSSLLLSLNCSSVALPPFNGVFYSGDPAQPLSPLTLHWNVWYLLPGGAGSGGGGKLRAAAEIDINFTEKFLCMLPLQLPRPNLAWLNGEKTDVLAAASGLHDPIVYSSSFPEVIISH